MALGSIASSQEQGLAPQREAKTVPKGHLIPSGKCGTRWQFRLARARYCMTKKCLEAVLNTGTGRTCKVTTCSLLASATSTSGTKSSRLGMEHLGSAGSGEVKTWRGGAVIEAGAEATLNNLAQISLLIYRECWNGDTILSCWRCEWLSDESTGELS